MGWTMPLSRMEAASSWSRAGSIAVRGWRGLGSSVAIGTSAADVSAESGVPSGSGRSAERPLPRAFRLGPFIARSRSSGEEGELPVGHDLLGELEVGLRPPRADVVEEDGLPEAGGLREADAPRHLDLEHLVTEVLLDLGHHLLGEVRPLVHHREE